MGLSFYWAESNRRERDREIEMENNMCQMVVRAMKKKQGKTSWKKSEREDEREPVLTWGGWGVSLFIILGWPGKSSMRFFKI